MAGRAAGDDFAGVDFVGSTINTKCANALLCRKYNELSSFIEFPIASGVADLTLSKCSAWLSRMQIIRFIAFQCSVINGYFQP